jgi:hypothetical protein
VIEEDLTNPKFMIVREVFKKVLLFRKIAIAKKIVRRKLGK